MHSFTELGPIDFFIFYGIFAFFCIFIDGAYAFFCETAKVNILHIYFDSFFR